MGKNYTAVLLEDINHKFDFIVESLAGMATAQQLQAVDDRLVRVENNVKIMKKVLREHSRELQYHGGRLNNHEKRITKLETA